MGFQSLNSLDSDLSSALAHNRRIISDRADVVRCEGSGRASGGAVGLRWPTTDTRRHNGNALIAQPNTNHSFVSLRRDCIRLMQIM